MKNRNLLAFGILSGILTTGIITIIHNIKERLNENKDLEDISCDYEDYDEIEYGLFEFDSIEDMNVALDCNVANIDSYYEIDNKGYVVALLDGNEVNLYDFGGRPISVADMEKIKDKVFVNSMYFCFQNEDYLKEFIKTINPVFGSISDKEGYYILKHNKVKYVDLSLVDKKFHDQIRGIAAEFFGKEVTDRKLAVELKGYFNQIEE